MDNMLDFLDGQQPAEATTAAPSIEPQAPEPVATPEAAPQSEGPARGPDGKFVGKAPEAVAAPVDASPQAPASPPAAVQTQEPAKAPEGYVPIAALQELRKELSAFKQSVQQPPQPAPDPYEDFEAYQAWQEGQVVVERAEWSKQLAEVKYGEDTVSKAQQWAAQRYDADPSFAAQTRSSRDPYGFAIEQYQQHQALQMLADPTLRDKFQAFLSGQAPTQQAPAAALSAPAPPQPVAPPPSITSAPSAGGTQHVPSGPGTAYGSIFG